MKKDRQSVNTRHAKMLAMIREQHESKVDELAEVFGVSLMTIRRDLQALEDKGLINRFYGGATVEQRYPPSSDKDDVTIYRQLIAKYAASLLLDGDYIFINGSSTAMNLLDYIEDKTVHVFTNNGLAINRKFPSGALITLSGGSIRGGGHIMTGDGAMRNLLMTQAEKAFIGCTGISPDGEILCGIPAELGINETMIAHAYEYYILADHTKIGKTSTYASCSLEKAGTVITDELAPADVMEQLKAIGMKVIQVKRSDMVEENN